MRTCFIAKIISRNTCIVEVISDVEKRNLERVFSTDFSGRIFSSVRDLAVSEGRKRVKNR